MSATFSWKPDSEEFLKRLHLILTSRAQGAGWLNCSPRSPLLHVSEGHGSECEQFMSKVAYNSNTLRSLVEKLRSGQSDAPNFKLVVPGASGFKCSDSPGHSYHVQGITQGRVKICTSILEYSLSLVLILLISDLSFSLPSPLTLLYSWS